MRLRTALLGALLALALWPAAAQATCNHFCRDRIEVKAGETTRWESSQTFASARGDTAINLLAYVKGRYLMSSWRGCRGFYFGHGVALGVKTCGDPTTIRLEAMSFGGSKRILLRYRNW